MSNSEQEYLKLADPVGGEANANDSVQKNATWLLPGTDSGLLMANEVWPDDDASRGAGWNE